MILEKIKALRGHGYTYKCKCDTCGNEFFRRASQIDRVKNHYCNRKCTIGKHHTEASKLKMSLSSMGNKARLGFNHSDETKIKQSLSAMGKHDGIKNANYGKKAGWKGGRRSCNGYILIYKPEHPLCGKDRCVLEHRFIMEEFIGRYLTLAEVVHHINEIRNDNKIENLMLFKNKGEHKKYHNQLKSA